MYVYTYVCMYVDRHTNTYMLTQVHMYVYTYVCMYVDQPPPRGVFQGGVPKAYVSMFTKDVYTE